MFYTIFFLLGNETIPLLGLFPPKKKKKTIFLSRVCLRAQLKHHNGHGWTWHSGVQIQSKIPDF